MEFVERPQYRPRNNGNALKQQLLTTALNGKAVVLSNAKRSQWSQYGWFKAQGVRLITRTVKQEDGSKQTVGWCEVLVGEKQ